MVTRQARGAVAGLPIELRAAVLLNKAKQIRLLEEVRFTDNSFLLLGSAFFFLILFELNAC